MIKKENALIFDDVISVQCREVNEINKENAWDVCRIIFSDEKENIIREISGVKINNDHISRMVSDDDLLYVRFKNPTSITMFKGD